MSKLSLLQFYKFQVYDYLDVVKNPMDFDQMQAKLDNHEYSCAQDFLDDIDLVAENAIDYNGDPNYETNKVICHRARALQDFAYALVKAEMDTDFEEDCKEIVRRRKSLTTQLKKTEKDSDKKFFSFADTADEKSESAMTAINPHRKRPKPRRKISKWQRGRITKPKKVKEKSDKEEQNEQNSPEKELDEEVNGEDNCEQDDGKSDENSDAMEDVEDEDTRPSTLALDVSSQSANEVCTTFELDEEKLKVIEEDLLKQTDNYPVENVERLYCHLMDCVRKFRHRNDRNNLIEILRRGLPSASKKASPKKVLNNCCFESN